MSLEIVSYNILADGYVNRDWYPNVAEEWLVAGRRRQRLVGHIAGLDADLICLQEVEKPALDALRAELEPRGFEARYANKHRRRDGCATLFRRDRLRLVSERTLRYDDGAGKAASGHLALITRFDVDGHELGVVNTHLRWSPPGTPLEESWAHHQVNQLIAEVLRPEAGWIMCGDFNIEPDHPIIERLRRAGMTEAYPSATSFTSATNGKAKKIDFILHGSALAAAPRELPPLSDETPMPSATQPSDHLAIGAALSWV